MNETITEQTIKPEDCEIGGNAFISLIPAEIDKNKPFYAFVKNFEIKNVKGKDGTDYGKQTVLILESLDGYEYKITDWNFATKKRIKVSDLIGKKVKFSAWSEKRALLDVAE